MTYNKFLENLNFQDEGFETVDKNLTFLSNVIIYFHDLFLEYGDTFNLQDPKFEIEYEFIRSVLNYKFSEVKN